MAMEAIKQIAEIEDLKVPQENEQKEEIPKTKWLFFFIDEQQYAVCATQVLNILKNIKLYNYPFAPVFIDGIINNHNKICPVVNYKKLVNKVSDDSTLNLYIVLKTEADDIAVRVTSVNDFYQIPDEAYSLVQAEDVEKKNSDFILGSLSFKEEKIPVLNVKAINEEIIGSCNKEVH